jgi:hypothetical protein
MFFTLRGSTPFIERGLASRTAGSASITSTVIIYETATIARIHAPGGECPVFVAFAFRIDPGRAFTRGLRRTYSVMGAQVRDGEEGQWRP